MSLDSCNLDHLFSYSCTQKRRSSNADNSDDDFKKLCKYAPAQDLTDVPITAFGDAFPMEMSKLEPSLYEPADILQANLPYGICTPEDDVTQISMRNTLYLGNIKTAPEDCLRQTVSSHINDLETDPRALVYPAGTPDDSEIDCYNHPGFGRLMDAMGHSTLTLEDFGEQEAWLLARSFSLISENAYVQDLSNTAHPGEDTRYLDHQIYPGTDDMSQSQIAEQLNDTCHRAPLGMEISEENQSISGAASHISSLGPPVSLTYDTCFGVLVVNTTSSSTISRSGTTTVGIKPFGNVLKLNFQDTGKYAGILKLPVLCKLLDGHNIKLTGALVASPSPKMSGKKKEQPWPTGCCVRITVYGLKKDKLAVGNLLSDAGLFLQHPSVEECGTDLEYCNPHYLVRPGSHMPDLDQLSISADAPTTTFSEVLSESNRNRFMKLFDLANDVSISLQVQTSGRLSSTLKDHQLTALAMMAEKECGIVDSPAFPSLWEIKCASGSAKRYRNTVTGLYLNSPLPVRGGILADDMGLGKTLSVLSLICWSLDMLEEQAKSRPTLVVAPKSTLPGWQQQIDSHIHPGQVRVAVYHGSARRHLSGKFKNYDIVLTTYETLRSDWITDKCLYGEEWYRIILDEAHHIRNRSSQIFKAACEMTSHYRWCLTGTPIHNSLDDYGALLSFVGVPPFVEKSKFDYWITSPIKSESREGIKRLQVLVKATCLRRTKMMAGYSFDLPQRIENIEYIDLHPPDQELYDFFKTKTANIAAGVNPANRAAPIGNPKENNILALINFLRLICNHGKQLLPESALEAWKVEDSASVDWQMMRNCRKSCEICDEDVDIGALPLRSPQSVRRRLICATCAIEQEQGTTEQETPGRERSRNSPRMALIQPSAKIEALLRNLHSEQSLENRQVAGSPIKSVVFTYWTKMLDLIQPALESNGFNICRIDGSATLMERRTAISLFNDDPQCTVMLASIGSAGEGIDLTVANHVHLIEPNWNPMVESQAVDRVHRIGQTRDVVIRRYLVRNSIETYIQWVQQDKLRLISRTLDSKEAAQSDIDIERWKRLQLTLGC